MNNKFFFFSPYAGETEVVLDLNQYMDGNKLCLKLLEMENGYPFPYADLTVNLPNQILPPFHAFLDTNNLPYARIFVDENELGEFTGKYVENGYCSYPLYRFYPEKLKELFPEKFEKLFGGKENTD